MVVSLVAVKVGYSAALWVFGLVAPSVAWGLQMVEKMDHLQVKLLASMMVVTLVVEKALCLAVKWVA
jgi:Na+/serine symporter